MTTTLVTKLKMSNIFLSSVFEFDQNPLITGAKALIKKYMSGFE